MDTPRGPGVPFPAHEEPNGTSPAPERPLGELFRALSRDASALLRQEFALAKAELRQNVSALARDGVLVVLGAFSALLGLLVLLAALVIGVGDWMGDRYALGALVVGVVLLAAGGGLALAGVKKAKATPLSPEETLGTLRNTGEWARAEAQGFRAVFTGSADADERGGPAPVLPARLARGTADGGRAPGEEAHRRPRKQRGTSEDAEEEARAAKERAPLPLSAPLWKRVMHELKADDLSGQAAKVAYYFFLSLPPALMAVFGLTGFFGGAATGDWLTGRLTTSLPAEASDLVSGFVSDIVHGNAPGPLSLGLLLALWAGSNVFTALEDTLNDAFGITAERSFVKKKAVAVGMLAACAILFLAGSAVLLAGGGISDALGLGATGRTVWSILQVPLGFGLITATFWLIYYVLPNKDQRGCKRTLLKASAIAAVLFVAASLAFRLYMANFGTYSATYGLLGTVIVLLLWMYVTSLVILLGGEVASEMERGA
ncbi:MAG TPA: YhjD/YihY/BrkB family envelope integrity protein [Longimicrobium sp.]|nr:YhjD/YihY/BrkB family envelope integrity protein [Longimicrobium sp.]